MSQETRIPINSGAAARCALDRSGAPGSGDHDRLVPAGEGVPTGVETGIRFTTMDAGAVHAELQAHGADVGELLRWPGVPPMFAVRDQDANGLQIVQAA